MSGQPMCCVVGGRTRCPFRRCGSGVSADPATRWSSWRRQTHSTIPRSSGWW
ncbi:hypothetical protein ALP29_02858 [Pseudomonas syringae pv. avii]|uniref:Uncharacterized protein n=1 Tax=Pseudomonas syringae pv. avii TaxID=663959 RepID=A0A3M5VCU0_PSESX|nr:hypothetical protein ALP29_02858 [Pseudomonas syringae pv. avii]